jgi:hypothetical protein
VDKQTAKWSHKPHIKIKVDKQTAKWSHRPRIKIKLDKQTAKWYHRPHIKIKVDKQTARWSHRPHIKIKVDKQTASWSHRPHMKIKVDKQTARWSHRPHMKIKVDKQTTSWSHRPHFADKRRPSVSIVRFADWNHGVCFFVSTSLTVQWLRITLPNGLNRTLIFPPFHLTAEADTWGDYPVQRDAVHSDTSSLIFGGTSCFLLRGQGLSQEEADREGRIGSSETSVFTELHIARGRNYFSRALLWEPHIRGNRSSDWYDVFEINKDDGECLT